MYEAGDEIQEFTMGNGDPGELLVIAAHPSRENNGMVSALALRTPLPEVYREFDDKFAPN